MSTTTYVPASELIVDAWPHWLGTAPDLLVVLGSVGVGAMRLVRPAGGGLPTGTQFDLEILQPVQLGLPFLPGFELHAGPPGANSPQFTLEIETTPHVVVRLENFKFTLHLPPTILQSWTWNGSKWTQDLDSNNQPKGFDFTLTTGLEIDLDTETVSLVTPTIIDDPGTNVGAMIGGTGVIIQMTGVQLVLGDTAVPGVPPGFRGIVFASAKVSYANEHSSLPLDGAGNQTPPTVILTGCAIGTGGFTGQIQIDSTTGLLGGTLFGMNCRLKSFGVTFASSVPTASSIEADLQLPFFHDPAKPDDWLKVEAAIGGQAGDLLLRLSDASNPGALVDVERKGLFDLKIASLAFHVIDGVPAVEINGTLKPELASSVLGEWPTFALNGLRIDANGHVALPGGKLQLPHTAHLSLLGFPVEISAIGFGSFKEGNTLRSYFGFSGAIGLTTDIGGEVRNLRVSWPQDPTSQLIDSDIEVTCEGIGIDLEIPDVLAVTGSVDFDKPNSGFAGTATLTLEKPFEATLGVGFLVGHSLQGDFRYWYLDALLDLPDGIPIAETGTAVYGGELLAGHNWAPNRTPDKGWFEDWYMGGTPGLALSPPAHVTDKWGPSDGSLVFGAGVVLGTEADDGYAFAGKVLLVLMLPGPIVLIEGRAQFLTDRDQIDKAPFRAVAILDFEHEEFLLAIAAHYEKSYVIDLTASAEAYFSLRDRGAWHLYLGEDTPDSKRAQALVLSIIHASAYFMLNANRLHTGASVSWGDSRSVGPLSIGFHVEFDENVDIFWHPFELAGSVHLAGDAHLSAFGVSLSLAVNAGLSAQAPDPLSVAGTISVELSLPWPLPHISADVGFSWSNSVTPNHWVEPLDSITLIHPLTSVTSAWTAVPAETANDPPYPLYPATNSLVPVPLDAHPLLSFGRPLNPGTSVAGVPPATSIARPGTLGFEGEQLPGVPGRFVSRLVSFTLSRYDGTSWKPVAQSQDPSTPWNGTVDIQRAVWGTWLDVKDRNGDWGPLQFELWNRYGFSRNDNPGSPTLGKEIKGLGGQLCAGAVPPAQHCVDFTDQPAGRLLGPVFRHAPGIFTVTRPAGIGARSDTVFPEVLFCQPNTLLLLTLDAPVAGLDLDLVVTVNSVTVTPIEGETVGASQTVSGTRVVHLSATTSGGITAVNIDVQTLGLLFPEYVDDAVITVPAGVGTPIFPKADCVRIVEELLLELLGGATPQSTNTLLAQLGKCPELSGKGPCRRYLAPFVKTVGAFQAAKGAARCQSGRAVAGAAGELMNCLLTAETTGVPPDCVGAVTTARGLLQGEVGLFSQLACGKQPVPANLIATFTSAVFDARTARLQVESCRRLHDPKPVGGRRVVAVGDPDDHNRWLVDIPGLAATSAAAPGCAIRQLCWVTVDEATVTAVNSEMQSRFHALMSQFEADVPLLEPHSQYQLTVITDQENGSVGSPTSWTKTVYFQTAGPPGDYIPGDPLDTLQPYLAATIPADGATSVFTTYDIGAVFNQPYVDRMYTSPGTSLDLDLLGADGKPATDAHGSPIVLQNNWSRAGMTTLQTYQAIIGAVAPHSDCGPSLPPVSYQPDPMTSAPLPAGFALDPNTRYVVAVVVAVEAGATGSEREVLRFAFTTGRYADFASLIGAARSFGPVVSVVPASLDAALAALGPIAVYDDKADDLAFRTALGGLGLAPRAPAAQSSATLLSDGTREPLILFEFDQPVDLRRLAATLYLDPDQGADLPPPGSSLAATLATRTDGLAGSVLRSADGRSVFIATSGHVDLTNMVVSVAFTFSAGVIDAAHFPNEPQLLRGGAASDEQAAVSIRFSPPRTAV